MKLFTLYVVVAVAALGVLFTNPAIAQRGRTSELGAPIYDLKTEITVKGAVESIEHHPSEAARGRGLGRMAGMDGMHILLRTSDGLMDVHLGPARWIAEHQFEVKSGDHIEVLGSKVHIEGKEALIARQVKKGAETLVLRDAKGFPMWASYRGW